MYTVRELSGSITDILDPTFRKVHFEDEGAIVTVSTHLRHAWTALPDSDSDSDPSHTTNTIGLFIKASHDRTDSERAAVPQNPDTAAIRTRWRNAIYDFWNHVFYDVMRWLPEVSCTVGHFHPPSHDVLAVPYPLRTDDDAPAPAATRVWHTNVLLIPAYLGPDVTIRAAVVQEVEDGVEEEEEGRNEKALGCFDRGNPAEIWYVRRGVEVRFYVEDEEEKARNGVAAVLVYGILCTENHGEDSDAEGKDGTEVGRLGEVERNASENGAVEVVERS